MSSVKEVPIEINGIKHPNEDTLILTHHADNHNLITARTYKRIGTSLHETDIEYQFNFTKNKWEIVHQHEYTYDLTDNGIHLVGDGSGWDGAGKPWVDYLTRRHFERLQIRLNEPIDQPTKADIPTTKPLHPNPV